MLYPILTYNSGFQVHKDCPWNMLPSSSFTEESVEGIVPTTNGLVGWHLAIRLDSMLKAVELPAGIANLHPGLSHMYRDTLTLQEREREKN